MERESFLEFMGIFSIARIALLEKCQGSYLYKKGYSNWASLIF